MNIIALLQKLNKIKEQLEEIQKALELYMETKRKIFPRFYFISNDDLLDILAKAKNPDLLQPHLKKCFDNVNRIKVEVCNRVVFLLSILHYRSAVGLS